VAAARRGRQLVIDAIAQRLRAQHLDRRRPARAAVEVCGAIGGAQAQVSSAARLSLAARVAGVTDASLRRAVEKDRTLVKTWTVRGTLHLVPAADLPMFVGAIGPVRRHSAGQWLGRSGIDSKTLDALTNDIVEALADGPLNRREIADRVGDAHGAKARQLLIHSWGGVFHIATSHGLVCFGPTVATQTTFVLTQQWLGATVTPLPPAEAEAALARKFIQAYGPATVRDFAYWAGLYAPDARRMWDRIASELRPVGDDQFVHASVRGKAAMPPSPHVRLLPNFDAFLLGHKGKDACVEPARYKKVFKNAGWISPVVLVDGRVRGTWSLERGTRGLVVRVAAFKPLSRAEREGVAREAEEVAVFAGLAARVRYGKSARPKAKVAWTGP